MECGAFFRQDNPLREKGNEGIIKGGRWKKPSELQGARRPKVRNGEGEGRTIRGGSREGQCETQPDSKNVRGGPGEVVWSCRK